MKSAFNQIPNPLHLNELVQSIENLKPEVAAMKTGIKDSNNNTANNFATIKNLLTLSSNKTNIIQKFEPAVQADSFYDNLNRDNNLENNNDLIDNIVSTNNISNTIINEKINRKYMKSIINRSVNSITNPLVGAL